MHCGGYLFFSNLPATSVLRPNLKWKLHLSGNGDFSCNHRWPLTLVVSFAAVIKEIDYDTSTFLSANIFIYITTMWRLVTCARQGTPSYQIFYTGPLTFQVLAVENCGTDRRSLKEWFMFSHLWATSRVAINTSEVAKADHGRLNRWKASSRYFAFLLWELLQQQRMLW